MFAADKEGVKIFDGSRWTVIPTQSGTAVFSVSASQGGSIFYGAKQEFGILTVGADSLVHTRPLSSEVIDQIPFGIVWAIHSNSTETIFQAERGLFVWNGSEISIIETRTRFHTSFLVGETVFVREDGVGLQKLIDGKLTLIPDGDFLSETRVYMIERIGSNRLLIGTQEMGLLTYDGTSFSSIPSELDNFQTQGRNANTRLRFYSGRKISDDLFAIATLGKGVVFTDETGQIISVLNEASGFPDNFVNFVYPDAEGNLWFALNNAGVASISLKTKLLRYGREFGISGHINGLYRVSGELLVTTGAELLEFDEPQLVDSRLTLFNAKEGIALPWHVEAVDDYLYVSTDEGLNKINRLHRDAPVENCTNEPNFVVYKSKLTGMILSGSKSGLSGISLNEIGCVVTELGEINHPIWSIVEGDKNEFWLGTRSDGVIRFRRETEKVIDGDMQSSTRSYSTLDGLPTLKIEVGSVGGEPVFVSVEGPYRYSRLNDKFTLDEALWPFSSPEGDSLLALTEDNMGNVWMAFPDSIVKAIPDGAGNYKFETPPALRFKKASTMTILAEDDGVVWFNDGDVLVRYDSKKGDGKKGTHNLLINRVTKYLSDAIIFRGNHVGLDNSIVFSQPESSIPELLYEESELAISYSSSSFTFPEETRYQTRIIGIDSTWSAWTSEKEFRIRKSGAGTYTFQARAKNSDGVISRVGSYSFIVLPPWYFTWWAYLLYVSLTALVAYSGGKYWLMVREHRLAEEQAKELAKEREFNKVLKEANDRLIKANKLKDEFLATTSHELRTPLTSILGFTSVLKDEIPESAEYREFLDIIEDSGNRLMETLNSLLDLAKLRSGMMELNLEISDIYYQCRDGISDLQSSASKKGLMLSINRPDQPLYVELDVLGFLRIIYNLVSNAIKFTEEGRISIELEAEDDLVHIKIIDTGIGIEKEFLPKLFDEFVQESDGAARTHEGFGLGLAITARLVRLMSGTIEVESEKGKGSTFIVTLPRVPAPESKAMRMRDFGINAG